MRQARRSARRRAQHRLPLAGVGLSDDDRDVVPGSAEQGLHVEGCRIRTRTSRAAAALRPLHLPAEAGVELRALEEAV
eukprot:scaffold278_cov42-Prasinocladus_malaysianus.AAC.2